MKPDCGRHELKMEDNIWKMLPVSICAGNSDFQELSDNLKKENQYHQTGSFKTTYFWNVIFK